MGKKRILVWETLATVSGGQKMTLTVMDLLSEHYEFCCLIPQEGLLSEELNKRNIPYFLMGDQTLPAGVKGKQTFFRYGWMTVKNVCRSLRAIRKYKPDILYCPGPAALPWSAFCGSLTQKPVVWHLHHIFLDGATKKLLNICAGWRSVKKIIAVSNCVGDQIINDRANGKVEILYNPVDITKYSSGSSERILPEIEKTLGRSIQHETVLGHIALIQNSKRQDFVLDVIKSMLDKGSDVVGIFAGECRDREYMMKLEQKAKEYSIDGRVVFLGRRDDVPDLLRIIDVLLIPSSEGFPLVGLEAATAGVPVAACDLAGAEEFVHVSGGGICFAQDDVSEAVKAIMTILDHKNMMINNGKMFASQMSDGEYGQRIRDILAHTI